MSEIRLIDARVPIIAIKQEEAWNNDKTDCKFTEGYACALDFALERIRQAPTINPVRHARWEAVNEQCNHAAVFRCSGRDGCGASVDYGHYTRFCDYEYCPNCGARMDQEGGEG